MRTLGLLATLLSLTFASLAVASQFLSEDAFATARSRAEGEASLYKEVQAVEDAAEDTYHLRPILYPAGAYDVELDSRRCRVAWERHEAAERRSADDARERAAAYKKSCEAALAGWHDFANAMRQRTIVLAAALAVIALGGLLTLGGSGRIGGGLMIVGALAPLPFAPLAGAVTAVFALLGLVAILLGFRKAAELRRLVEEDGPEA